VLEVQQIACATVAAVRAGRNLNVALAEQRARHPLPEKSAAARDYDSHPDTASAVRLRCQRAIIVF